MNICVFDIETSSLYANTGIMLCFVGKEYRFDGRGKKTIFRADEYKTWDKQKTDDRAITEDVMKYMNDFHIFVAHNGQYFDKTFLTSNCLKHGIPPKLRFEKFIDPVLLARKHMRLARNSLSALIDYFDIEDSKTPILWKHWMQATLNSDKKSMGYIVDHCITDVDVLEKVYRKTCSLVKGIDERGSAY